MRPNLLCLTAILLALPLAGCGAKNGTAPEATQPAPPAPGPDPLTGAGMTTEDAKRRHAVVLELTALALGLLEYHDTNARFPRADGAPLYASVTNKDGTSSVKESPPGFSWRAQVLHVYGQAQPEPGRDVFLGLCANKYPLAADARPGENWNRPALKTKSVASLLLRPEFVTGQTWDTTSRVFVGEGAAFEPGWQVRLTDFTDGAENTILIAEAGEAVPWPKPDELPYAPDKPLPKLGGVFPDGFYAAFADGTVRFIRTGTDEKLLRALITRNGGEPIAELPPKVDRKALRKAAGYAD